MKPVMMGVLLVGLVCLSGCADLDRMNAEAAARQHGADQNKCAGYGYQPGTDAFADCMMSTQHQRDRQQADAQRQAAWDKQRQADRDAKQASDNAAADAKHQADIEKMMNSNGNNSSIPPQPQVVSPTPLVPTGSNCTSTTTATQGDNAGSSTTTTTCH